MDYTRIYLTKSSLNRVKIFAHVCSFAYSTANTSLYAVSALTLSSEWIDQLDTTSSVREGTWMDVGVDVVGTIVVLILILQLLVSNQFAYAHRIAVFLRKDDASSVSLNVPVKRKLLKFSAIGGTYLKTLGSAVSLQALLATVMPAKYALCIFVPCVPLNAAAQFAIIGEKYQKTLFWNSLGALAEILLLSTLVTVVCFAVDIALTSLLCVVAVLFTFLLEMLLLTAKDSCVSKFVSDVCVCSFRGHVEYKRMQSFAATSNLHLSISSSSQETTLSNDDVYD